VKKINISFRFFIFAVVAIGISTLITWMVGSANTETGMGGMGRGLAIAFCYFLSLIIPFILSFIGLISGIITLSDKYTIGKLLATILNALLFSAFIVLLILILSA
jgi:hypothetical protein